MHWQTGSAKKRLNFLMQVKSRRHELTKCLPGTSLYVEARPGLTFPGPVRPCLLTLLNQRCLPLCLKRRRSIYAVLANTPAEAFLEKPHLPSHTTLYTPRQQHHRGTGPLITNARSSSPRRAHRHGNGTQTLQLEQRRHRTSLCFPPPPPPVACRVLPRIRHYLSY